MKFQLLYSTFPEYRNFTTSWVSILSAVAMTIALSALVDHHVVLETVPPSGSATGGKGEKRYRLAESVWTNRAAFGQKGPSCFLQQLKSHAKQIAVAWVKSRKIRAERDKRHAAFLPMRAKNKEATPEECRELVAKREYDNVFTLPTCAASSTDPSDFSPLLKDAGANK